MKQMWKKVFAGFMSAALAATLAVGAYAARDVEAEDTPVDLPLWSFLQGGDYTLGGSQYEGSTGNIGQFDSVTVGEETLTGWLGVGDQGSIEQTQSATTPSDSFSMKILNTGWDALWDTAPQLRINPWAIQANLSGIKVTPGHIYTLKFKAKASSKKYAYIAFGTDLEGEPAPYGEGNPPEGDRQLIEIPPITEEHPTEQEYTYTFTNWVSAPTINIDFMFGAFDGDYDFDGTKITDYLPSYEVQNGWNGTVEVSGVQLIDSGRNPEFVEQEPAPETPAPPATNSGTQSGGSKQPGINSGTGVTNQAPSPSKASVKKLGKVKKVKAKNNKKGRITITWKKVPKAKKYQVKVGKKTYTAKKTKLVVKKGIKKGKTYKVKVRAQAARGYKAGAWSKTVKVKVKK